MRRTVVGLATAFVVCLALITLVKFRSASAAQAGNGVTTAERDRISAFWGAYNQASALRTRGEFAQAAELYRSALRLNPNHEDSLYYLGSCLYELGEYAEAEEQFRSLIALNPQSGRAYGQLGRVLSVAAPGAPHDLQAAREAFQRELQIYTEQAGPLLELGGLELNQGQLARAEQDFRTAGTLGSAEADFLLGYTLFLENRPQPARRSIDNVLAKYAAERKLTGKGVMSEGDILPTPGKPLTPLQKTALRAMLLAYWNNVREGKPSEEVLETLRVRGHMQDSERLQIAREDLGVRPGGGRAAWGDYARDGHPGLAVGGKHFVLYRQQAGRYVDVTSAAGLAGIHDVREPYWADFDGDGYPDLYLVREESASGGQSLLYRNNRDGTFTDVTAAMGLVGRRSTVHACFGEFTGHGKLDLLEAGVAEKGSSVRLFRNTGGGFVDVTAASGLAATATAVDCAVADYDGDGRPDLFLQFWRRDARLYHNQGGGVFTDVTARVGLPVIRGQGLSAVFFDYDHDGRPDLLVTAQAPLEDVARSVLEPDAALNCASPRLFHNQGDGTFRETTRAAGLGGCYNTTQTLAADFDGDGWPDLLLVSGGADAQQLGRSVLLRNAGGTKFVPWAELPGPGKPANFLAGAVGAPKQDGSREVYLTANPVLSFIHSGGLFRIAAHRKVQSASNARRSREERVEANQ